ncbi:hypothetical protein TIFTF001_003854 [Ficus carica]|uniref:Uncharacterized protein n=1 Tax=Ficus carica TaxID=3494 RepID=A0AA87ZIT6_FICCA|nr:hypothetical protein TIFTF001_003854 [Ficus carica]
MAERDPTRSRMTATLNKKTKICRHRLPLRLSATTPTRYWCAVFVVADQGLVSVVRRGPACTQNRPTGAWASEDARAKPGHLAEWGARLDQTIRGRLQAVIRGSFHVGLHGCVLRATPGGGYGEEGLCGQVADYHANQQCKTQGLGRVGHCYREPRGLGTQGSESVHFLLIEAIKRLGKRFPTSLRLRCRIVKVDPVTMSKAWLSMMGGLHCCGFCWVFSSISGGKGAAIALIFFFNLQQNGGCDSDLVVVILPPSHGRQRWWAASNSGLGSGLD